MTSGPGKVSFSFGKIIKKPTLQVQPKETVKKVDKIEYIDSIEDNSVQVINADISDKKGPLVIPLIHPNLLLQSVIDTVNSRTKDKSNKDEIENVKSDEQPKNSESRPETLDEIAAREILEDATKQDTKKSEPSTYVVPLADTADQEESTLEDYENIPVNDFGLAMLRGMGWDPKKGIGKNGQVVKVTGPTVRPKGLGLGADKAVAAQKPVGKNVSDKAVLSKGSKVRITYGPQKNLYGTVEGFNDDAGRVDVFMALSSERISINESFVQLVTPEEFNKFGKVININAYNNYKDKETIKPEVNEPQNDIRKRNEFSKNGKSGSPDFLDRQTSKNTINSSLKSKLIKSDSEESDDNYSKKDKKYSSKRSNSKMYESDSDDHKQKFKSKYDREDSRDQKYSTKNKEYSKRYESKDKYNSNKKYDKYQKKHSSDSESDSEYEEKKVKHKSKGSCRDKTSRRDRNYSSSDSEYDRNKKKHKKSKKKRDRSRSRSRNRR